MNINDLDNIKVPKELKERLDLVYEKKSKIRKKSKIPYVIAACMAISLSGFAFPAYTKELPVYSHIFSIFEMGNYQEFGDTVLMEKKSNGIKVTIADIIYTGNRLSYSYIIETDEFLGKDLSTIFDISNNGKAKINGSAGHSKIEYKGDNTYIGYDNLTLIFDNNQDAPEKLDLNIDLANLTQFDMDSKKSKEYKGNWKFKISVNKLENTQIKPGFIFEKDGVFLKIDKITLDKVGTKIQIKSWDKIGLVSGGHCYEEKNVILKTEKGEILQVEGGSASGDKDSFIMYYDYPKPLTEGKYTLEFDFKKMEFIGYNEKGERERVAKYGTKEYENAPDNIKVSIPFEIEQNIE